MRGGRFKYRTPKPEWLWEVEVGDVLVDPSSGGKLRVVRDMTLDPTGMLRTATFAILRGSWTRRAYTTLNFNDLLQRGFRPTGARVPLDAPMDLALEAAIKQPAWHKYLLTCDDVRGVM